MFVHGRSTCLGALVVALAALALGVPRPSSGGGPDVRYIVQPGDTLWEIAERRYDGDPREATWRIKERNRLRTSALTPGMVLSLPAG